MFTNRITISRCPQTCVRLNKTYNMRARTSHHTGGTRRKRRTFVSRKCVYTTRAVENSLGYTPRPLRILRVMFVRAYLLSDTSPPTADEGLAWMRGKSRFRNCARLGGRRPRTPAAVTCDRWYTYKLLSYIQGDVGISRKKKKKNSVRIYVFNGIIYYNPFFFFCFISVIYSATRSVYAHIVFTEKRHQFYII